ncbi:hypothetical protein JOQ06_005425, partial [Pogonophryne albipinna]
MEGNMSLQTLWDAIQQIKTDMLTHIDSKMDPIQSSLSRIHNSLSSLGDQVKHFFFLEQRVRANEDNVHECVARVKQLEKDNSFLMSKVDDLENRSRCSSLRFVGIQESAEGSDIIGFVSRLIPQLLGPDAFPTLLIIERAHRSPTARQNSRASPRAIMIELLNFQDKVKILRLAREKKSLDYNGKHISIYPDFSPELTRRRRSFDPLKRKLCELNMKYFLLYPCTLCLGGLTLLAMGIWVSVDGGSFLQLLGPFSSQAMQFVNVGFFCIAIGAVLVLMGFLGCCGARKESKCLLLTFFSIILSIFIAEVAAGVVALAYSSF